MNSESQEEVLRKLQERSQEYADKTSQLSAYLENVETKLDEMPGKISCQVGYPEERESTLSFKRKQSGVWRLIYEVYDYEEEHWVEYLVTNSSVRIKALASQLLAELLEKILKTQTEELTQVDKALAALNSNEPDIFSDLDFNDESGGSE